MQTSFFSDLQTHHFGNRLFLVLAVDYLLLFCAETILPGFVTGVFSLTWFLFGVIALGMGTVTLSIFFSPNMTAPHQGLSRFLVIPLTVLLVLVAGIALFRVTLWQIISYLLLALLAGKMLYRYLLR